MELGIALLGYGSVSRKHIYALRNIEFHFPDYDIKPVIKVVYGRNEDKVREFSRKYEIPSYTNDMFKAISMSGINVIDIALPNYLHHEAAFRALELGKHVICEKPLAVSSRLAWEMYFKARDAKIVHGVVYNYRWLPAIIYAKKLIESGVIGKIYHFTGRYLEDYGQDPSTPLTWRYVKSYAGSGTLGDNATHVIDLARFLVSEIVEVCSIGKTFIKERPLPENREVKGRVDTDDEFISLVKFRNGAIGFIEASRVAAGMKNWLEIEVRGSKGFIRWNLNYLNDLIVYTVDEGGKGFMRLFITSKDYPYMERFWDPNGPIGLVEGFTIAFAEFLKSIKERKDYVPSFKDGAINCSVMDAMLKSWGSKRCVVVEEFHQ